MGCFVTPISQPTPSFNITTTINLPVQRGAATVICFEFLFCGRRMKRNNLFCLELVDGVNDIAPEDGGEGTG
jgi:hypothetical protein